MKVDNVKISNLANAIVASGLPFVEKYDENTFAVNVINVNDYIKRPSTINDSATQNAKHHIERCVKLCNAGSPHCNFLTGIIVSFNITATQAFFLQAHRYHWWQIISSQSKMHCLKSMTKHDTTKYDKKTKLVTKVVDFDDIEQLVYSCPMGLLTTERVVLNYQQLRTIYAQRKDHRLTEWRDFCKWMCELPFATEFLGVQPSTIPETN